MPAIRDDYPDLRLFFREATTDDLLEDLRAGRLDAILIALPYEVGDVEVQFLFADGYQLAVRPDDPIARKQILRGPDIADMHLMLLARGHCLQRHALSAFEPGGPVQDRSFEATSLPTLIAMVAEGLGATLLPQVAIDAGVADGQGVALVPLDGACPRRMVLAWRKASPRATEFRRLGDELVRIRDGFRR
ncbi:Transcriptional regulator, LysR family [Polymorphum gilvum SL003B-26A1]|uniref:Transcriptional regulator, LysR family n=1 Tax=Polymorphum gilvum (strain LMG 25793 / CGMCC 1.9160 / SL003B-26A1) TaxID=991905 RepID=F2J0K1_POLGS|nr:Transcriptional regulator, LysR family [Polymorphum gilvum SL003B-26A1]